MRRPKASLLSFVDPTNNSTLPIHARSRILELHPFVDINAKIYDN